MVIYDTLKLEKTGKNMDDQRQLYQKKTSGQSV
jgi:hypothetical protein